MIKNEDNKLRRLSFVGNEDIYFLLYNILIFLKELKYTKESQAFIDYRKLGFITLLMSNTEYINYFEEYYGRLNFINPNMRQDLKTLYLKGIHNNEKIKLLLLIMEKKGIINLIKEKNKSKSNLFLIDDKVVFNTFPNNIFNKEINNVHKIKEKEIRIRTIKYETFLDRLFSKSGVELWDI